MFRNIFSVFLIENRKAHTTEEMPAFPSVVKKIFWGGEFTREIRLH